MLTRRFRGSTKVGKSHNIKLGAVVSDVLGKSARQMLEALIAGESDPAQLAKLARGRMRPKIAQLQQALQGHLEPHHRFLLSQTLAHLDFLQQRSCRPLRKALHLS